ncbi:MAG TPA: hypothetical protein EYQ06_03915 [Flavobacteriales bacterium]|nr:hypothetical protein [Flavobacteriales bacterium]HIL66404.1 hypothetical protein [Flavobacteriales bacterium]
MKKLFYLFLSFGLLFSSCAEEEDPFSPSSSFSCMIDGAQLNDSDPQSQIITTNPALNGALEISATSNLPGARVMNTVTITIGSAQNTFKDNFLTDIDYILGSSNSGHVWQGTDIFATSVPNFTGTARFSKITANKVSGTFSFEALNTDPIDASNVSVTQGSFTDVSYQ